jgi:hypothetical protein
MMRMHLLLSANFTRQPLNLTSPDCVAYSIVRDVTVMIFLTPPRRDNFHFYFSMRELGPPAVVLLHGIVLCAVHSNISVRTILAFIQMPISHPWMLVEIAEWFAIRTLKTLFLVHQRHSGANGIPSSAIRSSKLLCGAGLFC